MLDSLEMIYRPNINEFDDDDVDEVSNDGGPDNYNFGGNDGNEEEDRL